MAGTAGKIFSFAIAAGMAAFSLAGCSDDMASTGTTVSMKGELTKSAVTNAARKEDPTTTILSTGEVVDSLKVSRVRILMSQLKLHSSGKDTSTGDNTVKAGPMMMTIDSAGTRTFTTATVPAGSYDKVKFEFHRFGSNEVGTYLNDTTYRDFVTDDRYTFIIDGMVYNNGTASAFTYRSDATANLTLKFDPDLTLADGSTTVIVLQVDPSMVFKSGSAVLDPRDGKNESSIDNAIKSAIKALKR